MAGESQERCKSKFLPSRSLELDHLPSGRFFDSPAGRQEQIMVMAIEQQPEIQLFPGVDNDRVFNFAHELERAMPVLAEHARPEAVENWLGNQVRSFLAEFGVGETLSVQLPYWLVIETGEEGVNVSVFNIPEYGEQSQSYTEVSDFPPAISEGLMQAYDLLSSAEKGEVVIIVSPTEFYQEYGSKNDVANLFRVVKVREDGSRLVEGRYLLLNILEDYQRAFLLNWYGRAGIDANASPEKIVSSPQKLRLGETMLKEEDPMAAHALFLNQLFRQQFGKDLLAGESDLSLYGKITELVKTNLSFLYNSLFLEDREESKFQFFSKLKEMMIDCQGFWAEVKGIDVREHIERFLAGQLPIGGFHSFEADSTIETNSSGEVVKNVSCHFCGKTVDAVKVHDKIICPKCGMEVG